MIDSLNALAEKRLAHAMQIRDRLGRTLNQLMGESPETQPDSRTSGNRMFDGQLGKLETIGNETDYVLNQIGDLVGRLANISDEAVEASEPEPRGRPR